MTSLSGAHPSSSEVNAQGRIEIVAMEGDSAPDGNGSLSFIYIPIINNHGDVAFWAGLTNTGRGTADDSGIFQVTAQNELIQVAREGELAPDGNGVFSSVMLGSTYRLSDSGDVAFAAEMTSTSGGTTDNEGIFYGAGGDLTQVVRKSDVVSGFSVRDIRDFHFNNAGTVAVRTNLDSPRDIGLSSVSRSVREMAAFQGQFVSLSFNLGVMDSPSLSDSGQIAYHAELVDTSNGAIGTAILRQSASQIGKTIIAREGDATPDGEWQFQSFKDPQINKNDKVAFEAEISNGDHNIPAIYVSDGATISEVVREGELLPDGAGAFFGIGNAAFNNAGQVAFQAGADAAGEDPASGVFLGDGNAVTQIVRTGQLVPTGNDIITNIRELGVNDAGHVAIVTEINDVFLDHAIVLGDGDELVSVITEGDALKGNEVVGVALGGVGQGFEDSLGEGMNNAAQVVFSFTLEDERDGVARFTPELHWRRGSGQWSKDANWTLHIQPDSVLYDTFIDPRDSVRVIGPSTNRTVRSLTLGSTDTGVATLELAGDVAGDIVAENDSLITELGELVIANGRALVAPSLTSFGVIRGDGTVSANLVNELGGEVRADEVGLLTISGDDHINRGRIEVTNGEMRFVGRLTSSERGSLIASHATYRFQDGFINGARVIVSEGVSRFHGDVTNDGAFIVTQGAEALFFDNVHTYEALSVSADASITVLDSLTGFGTAGSGDVFLDGAAFLGAPDAVSTMTFGGNVYFGGASDLDITILGDAASEEFDRVDIEGMAYLDGTLAINAIPLYGFPELGDTYQILTAQAGINGEFDVLGGAPPGPDLEWIVTYTPNSVVLEVIAPILTGDLNNDGELDFDDISLMSLALTDPVSYEKVVGRPPKDNGDTDGDGDLDFDDIEGFVQLFLGPGSLGATSIPEPSTSVLLFLATFGCAAYSRLCANWPRFHRHFSFLCGPRFSRRRRGGLSHPRQSILPPPMTYRDAREPCELDRPGRVNMTWDRSRMAQSDISSDSDSTGR